VGWLAVAIRVGEMCDQVFGIVTSYAMLFAALALVLAILVL
jgi:hypothetical protein